MDDQTLLALVNACIGKRLSGDAFESYTEQQNQFRGTPLTELYRMRTDLIARVAAASGGDFGLYESTRPEEYYA